MQRAVYARRGRQGGTCLFVALVVLVSACAPEDYAPEPGYNGFLTVISEKCYPLTIGGSQVSALVGASPPFLKATSRLYHRRIDADAYRNLVTAFSDRSPQTNEAINCIVDHLPPALPAPVM